MAHKSKKSAPHLTRLKVALASSGIIATLLGARVLLANDNPTPTNPAVSTVIADSARGGVITGLDAALTDLNLRLEAVPTVVAPTVRQGRVATGHASR